MSDKPITFEAQSFALKCDTDLTVEEACEKCGTGKEHVGCCK